MTEFNFSIFVMGMLIFIDIPSNIKNGTRRKGHFFNAVSVFPVVYPYIL